MDGSAFMPMPGPNPYLPPTADDVPLVGALADRPAAGPAMSHAFYFATDTRALYHCTLEWDQGWNWHELPVPAWMILPPGCA
jgi:hypothetical protein